MAVGVDPRGMRLAIVSTPRSGNTWVRHLLASALAAPEQAVHRPADVDWHHLPSTFVLQIHWPREQAFLGSLQQHSFRTVVLVRHPLDVLISILHFALQDRSTLQWLDSQSANERLIRGATPCSEAFRRYACGPRAAELLGISQQWHGAEGVWPLRYESMVADPVGEVERLAHGLELPLRRPVTDAVERTTLARLREQTRCTHHFWQGRPGLWRTLLPAKLALSIAEAHPSCFRDLRYEVDPDPGLDRQQAEENWLALIRPELSLKYWGYVRTRQLIDRASHAPHEQALDESLLARAKPLAAMLAGGARRAFRRSRAG